MPTSPPDRLERTVVTRFRLGVVGLCVAAVGISAGILHWIYPALSWNRDEPVYLWHAGVLRGGTLTAPTGDPVEAFRPWLSGIGAGRYFSQYTPGWPSALAASDIVLGSPAGAVAGGTVLAVLGAILLTRELTGRDGVSLAAGALVLTSPAIVIQSGVYLGYLFTLGLGCLALAAGWAGFRTRRALHLAASGVLLGLVALTRPFDAVVWGAILLVGGAVRHRGDVARRLWPVALAGVPFAVAALAYNHRVTASATTFPIVATDPLDTFGLGTRRLMPGFGPVDYGVGKAVTSTAKNALFTVVFLTGNVVTVALAGWAVWRRRRVPETWILVAMGLAFPVGYFTFWGTYLSSLTARLVGSIYFIPSMVPLCVLGILGALEIGRRRLLTNMVVIGALLTVPVLADRLEVNHRISSSQQAWARSVQDLDGPSLVIVAESTPYLMFKNPNGRNRPTLDDEILYALDLGGHNFETLRSHPDRTPYLQVASAAAEELIPKEDPIVPTVEVTPIELRTGRVLRMQVSFRPFDDAPDVVPFFAIGGRIIDGTASSVTIDGRGVATGTFEFAADGGPGVRRLPDGTSVLSVGFGAGENEAEAARDPRIRWDVPIDVERGAVTAMLPGQQQILFHVGSDRKWYPRPDYPDAGLRIDLRP